MRIGSLFLAVLILCPLAARAEETVAKLQAEATAAWQKGDRKAALKLATQAVELDPANAGAHLFLAQMLDGDDQFEQAIAAVRKVIALDPRLADAYQQLGMSAFKCGKVKDSAAAFDKYIALRPAAKPSHWMRGISLYYAGRFDEGKKQFDAYQKTDGNDVENAVWHFLCAARLDGVDKARAGMLKIGEDKRVPMKEIYDLYAGKIKPEDVFKAIGKGKTTEEIYNRQMFYAYLYLGIYADLMGDKKKAEEQLALAAGKFKIGHYMGDVARVHLQLLRNEKK